jgi:hypothetical protein
MATNDSVPIVTNDLLLQLHGAADLISAAIKVADDDGPIEECLLAARAKVTGIAEKFT